MADKRLTRLASVPVEAAIFHEDTREIITRGKRSPDFFEYVPVFTIWLRVWIDQGIVHKAPAGAVADVLDNMAVFHSIHADEATRRKYNLSTVAAVLGVAAGAFFKAGGPGATAGGIVLLLLAIGTGRYAASAEVQLRALRELDELVRDGRRILADRNKMP